MNADTRATLVQLATHHIGLLHNNSLLRDAAGNDMDKQCLDRFSMTWDETRKRVLSDMDSMNAWYSVGCFENVCMAGAGDWMIGYVMNLWLLKKWVSTTNSKRLGSQSHGFGGKADMERRVNSLLVGVSFPTKKDIYYIAPVLIPDLCREVLESHGIEANFG